MVINSDLTGAPRPEFIFVGDHPALDFANTLIFSHGQMQDLLVSWSDLLEWFSRTGLSSEGDLQLPQARAVGALKKVIQLRTEWGGVLEQLAKKDEVNVAFYAQLNELLAKDPFHEVLQRNDQKKVRLVRSGSLLEGEDLALAILARQISIFLSEANLDHLHRCANTASCVLYFYDTTKNHRRQWCSVATCGNRHKVAQFRERREKER